MVSRLDTGTRSGILVIPGYKSSNIVVVAFTMKVNDIQGDIIFSSPLLASDSTRRGIDPTQVVFRSPVCSAAQQHLDRCRLAYGFGRQLLSFRIRPSLGVPTDPASL